MALTREPDLTPSPGSVPASLLPDVSQPAVDLRLVGFRYHPAIGGAEQHARRLLLEIGDRLTVDVATVVTANRTDWLRLLIAGVRDREERYLTGKFGERYLRYKAGARRWL